MLSEITLGGVFLAGLVSFLSPCVLPLVPAYLCYLTGVSLDQLTGQSSEAVARRTVVLSAAAFVAGFSTVFILVGASATAIGQLLRQHQEALAIVGGVLIVIVGLHFLGVFRIGFLYREKRLEIRRHPAGPLGSYLVGLAFAIGWTPCIGPVLGTIWFVAGSEDTVAKGAGLLAIYSLGLGLPFIAAGFFAQSFMHFMQRFRRHLGTVEKAMGALLVVTGILFVTGQMSTISFWLLETFPSLGLIG